MSREAPAEQTMSVISQGGNVSLNQVAPGLSRVALTVQWAPPSINGVSVDASAFVLGASGKVLSDADFVFYNQPQSADGAVVAAGENGAMRFTIDLDRINPAAERIAFVATIDGAGVSFGAAQSAALVLSDAANGRELARFDAGTAGRAEAALIFGELYRRSGEWKLRAIGQGFNGGLKPLAEYYGVVVDDTPPAAPASAAAPPAGSASSIWLEKRLIDLEKKDPAMLSLVKKVQVSLEKQGLTNDSAKVALVLDISPSMMNLFQDGSVDELVRRILALGLRFDDDGQIDVFLFGKDAFDYGSVDLNSYRSFVQDMLRRYGYSGGTYYGKAMQLVRETYRSQPDFGRLPIYIMFITDGGTADPAVSERHVIESSHEPFFWQFLAIGQAPSGQKKQSRWSRIFGSGFDFLEKLDNLPGRLIDNASFGLIESPRAISEDEMFDMLMEEYPTWVRQAQEKGLIRG
jgi:stress response protein SCP2